MKLNLFIEIVIILLIEIVSTEKSDTNQIRVDCKGNNEDKYWRIADRLTNCLFSKWASLLKPSVVDDIYCCSNYEAICVQNKVFKAYCNSDENFTNTVNSEYQKLINTCSSVNSTVSQKPFSEDICPKLNAKPIIDEICNHYFPCKSSDPVPDSSNDNLNTTEPNIDFTSDSTNNWVTIDSPNIPQFKPEVRGGFLYAVILLSIVFIGFTIIGIVWSFSELFHYLKE